MSEGNGNNNGNGFNEAIAAIAAARAATDPLAAQRLALAPVRALAVAYIDAFQQAVARRRPEIESAMERYNRSVVEVGIKAPELRKALVDALALCDTGANGFRGIIVEIDKLDRHTVQQQWHRMFLPRLEAFRPNIGDVDTQANRVAVLMAELERRVLTTVPVSPPAPVMATGGEPTSSQTIVTDFDPRMRL